MTNFNDISKTCILNKIRTCSRHITTIYEEAFKPLGLTASQFIMLITLSQLKQASIVELAGQLKMDHSTLSRNIKPLMRDGLLKSKKSEQDARTKLIEISPLGYDVLSKATPLWEASQKKSLALISDDVWQQFDTEAKNLQ